MRSFLRSLQNRSRLYKVAGALALALAAWPAEAVGQDVLGTQRRQASRAEIEQAISAAEQVASTTNDDKTRERLLAQAGALRQRLQNGDFAPGDRLMITVLGDSALTDTFTVRMEQVLQLPNLPDITLRGVLDSELQGYLTEQISKYIREPSVSVIGLVRLNVSGAIAQPGFVTVPIDLLVTDVIMAAGGPGQGSDLNKSQVKRGNSTVLNSKQLSEALRTGRTVGDISLRDGDEIFIATRPTSSRLMSWLPVVSALTTVYFIVRWRGGGRGTP